MATSPAPLAPLLVAPLLRQVDDRLLELLDGMSLDDWDQPTIVPGWHVRHVAAHLLDTPLRKLAVVRDGFGPDRPRSGSPEDVRALVDRLNADGVAVYGRLSPTVVRSLMETATRQASEFHLGLDPFATAVFAVSWAGEAQSMNWFDTARELTERWHHQQQIRLALLRPGIMTPEFYRPVLDCFLRVLPHAYRTVPAPAGVRVTVRIAGPSGGDWHLYRHPDGWMLTLEAAGECAANITIPEEIAWRVFTKGMRREEAEPLVTVAGSRYLALPVLTAVAIVG